jgi:uncharacterized protein (DUF433 family)
MTPTRIIPIAETIDLSQYIENRLMSGRPHIKGRRIPVSMVVANATVFTVEQIADEFDISPKEVLSALFYYQNHQIEIDQQNVEDETIHAEMSKKLPPHFRRDRSE